MLTRTPRYPGPAHLIGRLLCPQRSPKKGYKAEFGDNSVTIVKSAAPTVSNRKYSSAPSDDMVQKKKRTKRVVAKDPKPRDQVSAVVAADEPAIGGGGFSIRPYKSKSQNSTTANSVAGAQEKHLVGKDIENSTKSSGDRGNYVAVPGVMLHQTLSTWAEAAGWTVSWESNYDYQIEADATFSGDFVDATTKLVSAMKNARPTIAVDFYKGNNVVVISNNLADQVN